MTRISPRLLLVVLVASLALNVFLGARYLAHRMSRPSGPDAMLTHLVEDMGSELSRADGEALRRVFESHHAQIKSRAAALHAARQRVREAIMAEPLDRAALRAAMESVRQKDMDLHQALEDMLFEAATQISPEGRTKLATFRRIPRR